MDTQTDIVTREITFDWTLDFARVIKRRHFSRQIRRPCLVFLPIGIIGLLGVWLHSQKGESGGGYWLLICLSISPFVLWAMHHWATSQMRATGAIPRYTVRVEPESITVTSEKGSSTLKWSAVKTVWKFPDVVLLFFGKKLILANAIALPPASLGMEVSRYIEDRVTEHGGRVA